MHIAAASDDDEAPLINIWDLHMTIAPNSTLKGHQRGVMSIAWCPADKSIMTSTGKDNRTLCWDVATSTLVSEIGTSANWNLDVQWSSRLPTMLSTCSLEGKIRIYSVSDFENLATPQSMESASLNMAQAKSHSGITEDDLFNLKGHNQHLISTSSSNVLKAARQCANGARVPPKAPAWLKRPAGASFGFGGKLVSFSSASTQISVHHVPFNQDLSTRANALQTAMTSGDFSTFCEEKLHSLSSSSADIETWSFLKSLLHSSPRQEVLSLLDMDPEKMSSTINEYLRTLPTPPGMLEDTPSGAPASEPDFAASSRPTGTSAGQDDLFDGTDDDAGTFVIPKQIATGHLTSTNPTSASNTGPPISLASSTKQDQILRNALLIGDYEAAVECCVRIGRMADALIIASCGGDKLLKQTQNIFFRQNKDRSYLQVLSSIVNKNLVSFISRIELAYWKEALSVICTYASDAEYVALCNLLGNRLFQSQPSAATLCFLCSGAVDQVTSAWLISMNAASSQASDPSQRHALIQELMEKVIVFTAAVKLAPSQMPDLVLQQFARYAELLANQGMFETSLRYLKHLDLTRNVGATSAAFNSTLQLLDRVYNALPPTVAQSCFGGPLQNLYKFSRQVAHPATPSSTFGKATSAKPTGAATAATRTFQGPTSHSALAHHTPSSNMSPSVFGAASMTTGAPVPPPHLTQTHVLPPGPGSHTMAAPHAPNPYGSFAATPASRGQRATFTPVTPVAMSTMSGASTSAPFMPGPPLPSGPVATAPPPAVVKRSRVPPPVTGSFTPSTNSAPSPPPAPAELNGPAPPAANGAPPAAGAPKKKKVKKSAAAPKVSATLPPLNPLSPATTVAPVLPPMDSTQGVFPAAHGFANAASPVNLPPQPKARATRVQPPTLSRGPAAPNVPPVPPPQHSAADPATWNPQQPLPPHLLATGALAHPPHAGHFHTPAGFHPPPPSAFVPSLQAAPATSMPFVPSAGTVPTAFQPARTAPAASPTPPPPKPGRAKKDVSVTVGASPTPVYVTGPQAEAMAAPKEHESSPTELDLLASIVQVLDKIQTTGDPAHPDLVSRFEDFKSRITAGTIPEAIIPTLSEMVQAMLASRYPDAQEMHGEVTNSPHYHAIGSKAMLGFKRMIILIQRHNI